MVAVQRTVNFTAYRITGITPLELLTEVKLKNRYAKRILKILKEERINSTMEYVNTISEEAEKSILKIHEGNQKYYKKKKKAYICKKGDISGHSKY